MSQLFVDGLIYLAVFLLTFFALEALDAYANAQHCQGAWVSVVVANHVSYICR